MLVRFLGFELWCDRVGSRESVSNKNLMCKIFKDGHPIMLWKSLILTMYRFYIIIYENICYCS